MGSYSRTTLLPDIVKTFSQARLAFFVLALGLVISFAAWRFTEERVGGETAAQFQHKVAQTVDTIDRRFQDNLNLLLGLKGLFAASSQVDRDEFQRYLEGLDLAQRHAGVRLVSFVRRVTLSQRTEFEESVRRDKSVNPRGYPVFAIRPPGDRD